jgi:hypothetical protein
MGVIISPELEKVPYWHEIRDYVNERMAAECGKNPIFIRLATRGEEAQLRESGNSILVSMREGGIMELVIGAGKYLDFEEILKLDRKFGNACKNLFLHLWVAQLVCMGNIVGGCDS